jgi:hypothetical protein
MTKFTTNEAFIGYFRLIKICMCTGMTVATDNLLILAREEAPSAIWIDV